MRKKKVLNEREGYNKIVNISIGVLVAEMWKDVNKEKVDEFIKNYNKKGMEIKNIKSSTFNNFLK